MSEFKNRAMGGLILALAAYGAIKAPLYYRARYRVNQLLAPLSRVAHVTYTHMNVSLFGPVGISDLSIVDPRNGASLTIKNATLRHFDYTRREFLPRRLSLTLDGVYANAALMGELPAAAPDWLRHTPYGQLYRDGLNVAALGYDGIKGNIALDLHYDPNRGALRVRSNTNARDMGKLRLRASMTGFTRDDLRRGLPGLTLRVASLDYRDASFVQRLFAREARREKIAVAQYQSKLARRVGKMFVRDKIKLAPKSSAAITRFLLRPRHLVISMAPYNAVSLRDLRFYKVGDIPMLLNLQIRN